MDANDRKVAIVTGSATGVGAATCKQLSSKGWNVVINYSRSEEDAYKTADECRKAGVDADVLVLKADVSVKQDCTAMVEATIAEWGRIDALVNNAGVTKYCDYNDLEGLTKEDFLRLYSVNVIGAYQMTSLVVPYMKRNGEGAIVNTSSISALTGIGSSIAYAASKGALTTLTLALAHALKPDIRVNAVCPGFIQGRWTQNMLGDNYEKVKKNFEGAALLEKTAKPEEVAETIVYLVCYAGMITGQVWTIDGGFTINHISTGDK